MSIPLLVLLVICINLVHGFYKRARLRLPPGPRPWPVFGNIFDINPRQLRWMAELSDVYGPITTLWVGSSLNINVSSSDLAKEVLKENDHICANRPNGEANYGKVLIWSDYGSVYVKLRKVCIIGMLSPRSLEALRPIRECEIAALVESVFRHCERNGDSRVGLVVRDHVKEAMFEIISRMVFGESFRDSDGGEMSEEGKEIKAILEKEIVQSGSIDILDHIPGLWWISWFWRGEIIKEARRKDHLTRNIVQRNRLARAKDNNGGADGNHFLARLLALQDEYKLTDENIIALLWDLMIAAVDTVALSVEWILAEVIKNPSIQQKVQEELDGVVGSSGQEMLSESDLLRLPYLQCVVKESFRLHPPTPLMIPHKANATSKLGGYDVPKGSLVHVNVWAIGRDPKNWEDPLAFLPDRFLDDDRDIMGHDFRLLPFGSGRRACPGSKLGKILITSILGHLLHNFKWSLPPGMEPEEIDMSEMHGLISYMNTPLQALATPRRRKSLQ